MGITPEQGCARSGIRGTATPEDRVHPGGGGVAGQHGGEGASGRDGPRAGGAQFAVPPAGAGRIPGDGPGLRGRRDAPMRGGAGLVPVVPPKSNRLDPWEYDRETYKKRNEVDGSFASSRDSGESSPATTS